MSPRALAIGAGLAVLLGPAGAGAAPPWESREDILCRVNSAVGFSYWWGNSCWCASGCNRNTSCGAGGCSGSCPGCNHWGSYGADCSGLVNKAWQVPGAQTLSSCSHGPYTASSYTASATWWTRISRSSLQPADALASSSHVMIFDSGDPWGWLVSYEARGCSYGIVHNSRTCSSAYSGARRDNITTCECSSGQTQSQGCGNCGTRTRTCGGNCQWGSWSSCQGQGACAAGSTQSAGCCDCGTHSRSCGGNCQWSGWSACSGPDPAGGSQWCDTGQIGPCAEGRMRCLSGCLACVRTYEPIPELCDAVDNDCNGAADEGDPQQMGTTVPSLAARLVDGSWPTVLAPSESATAWAEFENLGSATWRRGLVWLGSQAAAAGQASPLFDPDGWPAWNVAATLDEDVPPGERAFLAFSIRAPEAAGSEAADAFRLMGPGGVMLDCPSPEIALQTLVLVRDGEPPVEAAAPVAEVPTGEIGLGCQGRSDLAPGGPRVPVAGLLAALFLLPALRRGSTGTRPS